MQRFSEECDGSSERCDLAMVTTRGAELGYGGRTFSLRGGTMYEKPIGEPEHYGKRPSHEYASGRGMLGRD